MTSFNAFGLEVTGFGSARTRLMLAGLHPTDPRFDFAERAVQAVPPARQPVILARFGREPKPVALPTGNGREYIDAEIEQAPAMQEPLAVLDRMFTNGDFDLPAMPLFWSRMIVPMHAALLDRSMSTLNFVTFSSLLPGRSGAAEIICLPQAFVLAVCLHPNHRAAAVEWLTPYARTWLRDWLEQWPAFALVFLEARQFYGDLPDWLGK